MQTSDPSVIPDALDRLMQNVTKVTQEEADSRDVRIAKERATERANRLLEECGAPKRHLSRKQLNNSGSWEKWLQCLTGKLGTGFQYAIIGGNGPGKTQMAIEVLRHCICQRLQPARYTTAVRLFMDIKACYGPNASEVDRDVINRFSKPRLLIIDEVNKRSDSNWENMMLFELIDRRYQDMTDTIIIANQTESEFAASMGSSLVSRINELGGLILCDWPSFRD